MARYSPFCSIMALLMSLLLSAASRPLSMEHKITNQQFNDLIPSSYFGPSSTTNLMRTLRRSFESCGKGLDLKIGSSLIDHLAMESNNPALPEAISNLSTSLSIIDDLSSIFISRAEFTFLSTTVATTSLYDLTTIGYSVTKDSSDTSSKIFWDAANNCTSSLVKPHIASFAALDADIHKLQSFVVKVLAPRFQALDTALPSRVSDCEGLGAHPAFCTEPLTLLALTNLELNISVLRSVLVGALHFIPRARESIRRTWGDLEDVRALKDIYDPLTALERLGRVRDGLYRYAVDESAVKSHL